MRAVTFLLLALIGCGSGVQEVRTAARERPPWCFEASYRAGGTDREAWGCYETPRECQRARGAAIDYGRAVGVRHVTPCGVQP